MGETAAIGVAGAAAGIALGFVGTANGETPPKTGGAHSTGCRAGRMRRQL
jgi:hypothetical protein